MNSIKPNTMNRWGSDLQPLETSVDGWELVPVSSGVSVSNCHRCVIFLPEDLSVLVKGCALHAGVDPGGVRSDTSFTVCGSTPQGFLRNRQTRNIRNASGLSLVRILLMLCH